MRLSFLRAAALLGSLFVSLSAVCHAEERKEFLFVTTDSGLKYQDLEVGGGSEARAGDMVDVHYTGWLATGVKFDSSMDRGQSFQFKLGSGVVIKGWDEGIAGMRVGQKRKLMVPNHLAYGKRAVLDLVPPGADLVFEIELLRVR